MPKLPFRSTILFAILLIALLFALTTTAALAAQAEPAVPTTTDAITLAPPVESFRNWQRQGENNQFDLNRCQIVASGDVNGDGRPDLDLPLQLRRQPDAELRPADRRPRPERLVGAAADLADGV